MFEGITRFQKSTLVAGVASALLAGCPVMETSTEHFACTRDIDCGAGWRCESSVCRPATASALPPAEFCSDECARNRRTCCGSTCVDPSSDTRHCGGCGKACADGEGCAAGKCVREEGALCANGVDDDLDSRVDCADDVACPNGTLCSFGRCCGGACVVEAGDLCANDKDDDCDGSSDCADPSCSGAPCAGGTCQNGACVARCFIDRTFFDAHATRDGSPCEWCDPTALANAWSVVPDMITTDGCTGTSACNGSRACRRANGQPCAGDGDCASENCVGGRCVR